MTSSKTKFQVGLFVLTGAALAIGAVVWLGVTRFFESGSFYVTYFNESVQGLNKDSQVKFRGVPVGRVQKFQVAPDSQHIEVLIWIESGWKPGEKVIAQLKPVGITGSAFIELDQRTIPRRHLSLDLDFDPEYPVIPSRPSQTRALFDGVDEVISRINQTLDDADVRGLSLALKKTLSGIDRLVTNPRIPLLVQSLQENSSDLQEVMSWAEKDLKRVEEVLTGFQAFLGKNESLLHETLKNINSSALVARGLIHSGSDDLNGIKKQVELLLENINQTDRELNQLLRELRNNPSQLLVGSPPAPRSMEP